MFGNPFGFDLMMLNEPEAKNVLKDAVKNVKHKAAKHAKKVKDHVKKNKKKVEKKIAHKKDLEAVQKAKIQAAKSLDELVREYGMEPEAEAIYSDQWDADLSYDFFEPSYGEWGFEAYAEPYGRLQSIYGAYDPYTAPFTEVAFGEPAFW